MKAVLSKEVGGPETLVVEELESPTPGKGEVLIDVAACAINFPDSLIIKDMYQMKPPRPFSPGGEISGTIAALGEGVSGWQVGDRVIAGTGAGGLREQVVLSAARLFKVPEGIDLVQASALLMTYGTTIHGLKDRGDIKAGDTVLVLGAAGGVGLSAVELAKAYGARVVAAVSTEEKGEVAKKAGADEVVIYDRAPFDKDQSKALAQQFKDAVGPEGADIVYDIVGGDYSEPALRSIAWEGRFLVIGFPAGIAKMPLNLTRQCARSHRQARKPQRDRQARRHDVKIRCSDRLARVSPRAYLRGDLIFREDDDYGLQGSRAGRRSQIRF